MVRIERNLKNKHGYTYVSDTRYGYQTNGYFEDLPIIANMIKETMGGKKVLLRSGDYILSDVTVYYPPLNSRTDYPRIKLLCIDESGKSQVFYSFNIKRWTLAKTFSSYTNTFKGQYLSRLKCQLPIPFPDIDCEGFELLVYKVGNGEFDIKTPDSVTDPEYGESFILDCFELISETAEKVYKNKYGNHWGGLVFNGKPTIGMTVQMIKDIYGKGTESKTQTSAGTTTTLSYGGWSSSKVFTFVNEKLVDFTITE